MIRIRRPHPCCREASESRDACDAREGGRQLTVPQGVCRSLGGVGEAASAAGWQLTVEAGAAWLTWPGCDDDCFLRAGEAVALPADLTRVLLEAEPRLAPGAVRVSLRPLDCDPSCRLPPPPMTRPSRRPRFLPRFLRAR